MNLKYNGNRAQWILICFYIFAFISGITIISEYLQYSLLVEGDYTDEEATMNDLRVGLVGLAQLSIYIITVVFFILWFRRAYYNLNVLGYPVSHTEGWAAGAWFVPILNLFRPYQIMKENWYGTQIEAELVEKENHSIVKTWWIFWLLSNFFSNGVARYVWNADSLDELAFSSQLNMVNELISFIPLILIIIIIRKMRVFEEELYHNKNSTALEDHIIIPD